ncbi:MULTISPECIES: acyl-CoA carboxylase subunit epsilon [Micromonospora]|uniref:Acyl-CoA carboxylase epsilon subunit n=1 Tax=Micromonospora yangpuensis TaxID=683228 RepID=A0A1C6UFN4_9ACTN|nr:acyl-CoA carboxylase subunit epsilon [Micromonospora yangpuensis]GGM05499.1 hypothetical protein GCM10012279_24020 [Micromonospora yangpuensis]SCL52846.1 Acyl-CoA carboxylase epsilon subunit [Micromonospora yangpuensis]
MTAPTTVAAVAARTTVAAPTGPRAACTRLRVLRGEPTDDEVTALTAVLLVRAAARDRAEVEGRVAGEDRAGAGGRRAGWGRPAAGYRSPASWR